MSSVEGKSGLIGNKRDAIIAVILTAIIAASALRGAWRPMRHSSPWLFDTAYGLPRLTPLLIGLSVFFWVYLLWILFWFYRAARGKYERFLLASFATGFVFSTIKGFMPVHIAVNMQYLSTAASLLSLVSAATILVTLLSKATMPE
jgi:hypothetical protein